MTRRIILASTSRYRRTLLEQLGVTFEQRGPGVDEDAVKALGLPPEAMVARLADDKARAVAQDNPNAIIIGSDQCAALNGVVLGKPGTVSAACAQLQQLAGATHQLWTAVTVLDTATGERRDHVDLHQLTMRALSPPQIAGYVAKDQPLDCAGSYKIEALGRALFTRVEGEDSTAIVGLPLGFVSRALFAFGVDVLAG